MRKSAFWLPKSIFNFKKIVSELFGAFLNIYFYKTLTLDLSLLLAAVFARLSTPRIRNICIILPALRAFVFLVSRASLLQIRE